MIGVPCRLTKKAFLTNKPKEEIMISSRKRKNKNDESDHDAKKARNDTPELVNGISFDEMKKIYNAIIDDDSSVLEANLDKISEISYSYEFFNDDLTPVNWSSEIQRMSPRTWMTLLHFAARIGRSNCVQVLIDKQSDLNKYSYYTTVYTDSDSETDVDFDKNVKLNFKRTPLHELCIGIIDKKSDFRKCAQILLENGADLEKPLNNRRTNQTAYEFALNIKKEKKKIATPSFFDEFFSSLPVCEPRTEAAEQIKSIFAAHKKQLENNDDKKLSK